MPRALKICATHGCSEIANPGGRYCAACLREARKRDNQRRNPANKKKYRGDWPEIRAEHLRLYPYCVNCGAIATQVDHILPLSRGGTHDHYNLNSMCHSCHSRKTATQDGGFGNPVKKETVRGRGV